MVASQCIFLFSVLRASREFLSPHGSLHHRNNKRRKLGSTNMHMALETFEERIASRRRELRPVQYKHFFDGFAELTMHIKHIIRVGASSEADPGHSQGTKILQYVCRRGRLELLATLHGHGEQAVRRVSECVALAPHCFRALLR